MICSVFTILAILHVMIKLLLSIICLDKTNLIDYSAFTYMNNGLMEIVTKECDARNVEPI